MNENSNYNHVLGDMSQLEGHIDVRYEFDTEVRKLPIALCMRRVDSRLTQPRTFYHVLPTFAKEPSVDGSDQGKYGGQHPLHLISIKALCVMLTTRSSKSDVLYLDRRDAHVIMETYVLRMAFP